MSLHRALGHLGTGEMAIGNGSGHHAVDGGLTEDEIISSWILVVVCVLLMCISVPCNLLVLIAFATVDKLRTHSNLFIVNLCVSDLCIGAVNMPLTVLEEAMKLSGRGWPFAQLLCHSMKTLQHVFFTTSILTILIICNDRYQAIRHPLTHRQNRTTRSAGVRIIAAWCVAGFIWFSFILVWGMVKGDDSLPPGFCTAMYNTNHYSTGVAIGLAIWIPYPAVMVMYCRVYQTIRTLRCNGQVGTNKRTKLSKHQDCLNTSQSDQYQSKTDTVASGKGSPDHIPSISASTVHLNYVHHDGAPRGERFCECGVQVGTPTSKDHQNNTSALGSLPTDTNGLDSPPYPLFAEDEPKGDEGSNVPPVLHPSRLFRATKTTTRKPSLGVDLRRPSKTRRDSQKAALTLSLVVTSYAICWLPYGIIIPITSICEMHPGAFPLLPAYFNAVAIALPLCQSALNPFCYAAAQPAIRHNIMKILTCARFRK